MAKPLTVISISALRPDPARRLEIADGGARGLLLLVHPSGKKSWIMRFRRKDGRMAKLTLGPVDLGQGGADPRIGSPLTLAAARRAASLVAHQRACGADPIGERAREKEARHAGAREAAANSFGRLAREFVDDYARKEQRRWKETARLLGFTRPGPGEWLSTLKDSLAERWAARPVAEITAREILTVLRETRDKAPPGLVRRRPAGALSEGMSGAMFAVLSRILQLVHRPANN